MKKIGIITFILFITAGSIFLFYNQKKEQAFKNADKTIYINVEGIKISKTFLKAQKLASAFNKEGKTTVVSDAGHFKSGNFNLYFAEDLKHLPKVKDLEAINVLYIPMVNEGDDPELLREFDVVIVKSMAAFEYLKAINVRTAYIPDAVDIKTFRRMEANGKVMFYGENKGLTLPLYLAGRNGLKLDVYGTGFEKNWPLDEIKGAAPQSLDFCRYSAVLLDQDETFIRDELINEKIIETLENGGLPMIRYNRGVERLFGEAVIMYHGETEFIELLAHIKESPFETAERREALYKIAQGLSSHSQALKFNEIFEIMEKKRQ